jgi:capsular exopolysaccharide synthesis family protein
MAPPIIKRYLIAFDQHKLLGLASFAVIVGISGIVAIQPPSPPTFKALGLLAYTTPPRLFSTTGEQIQQQGKQLMVSDLLPPKVIIEAAEQLKVKPQEIAKKLDVKMPSGPKDPQVIFVGFTDDNPKLAVATVKVLLPKMVQQSRLVNTDRLRDVMKSIEQRLPEAKEDLRRDQQRLERYIRVEGSALLAAQDGTLVGAITGSQQQQRQIQLTLGGIETEIQSLENRLGLTADEAYTNSALSADPIIASLRSQIMSAEMQVNLLRSQGYRDAHPTLEKLLRDQQTYEKMLQERADEVIGGKGLGEALTPSKIRADSTLDPTRQQLANQLVSLQTQRDTLKQQLEATKKVEQELRKQYLKLPDKQLEQARLQQQFELQKTFYAKLQASLADARAAEAETVSSIRIAQEPEKPEAVGGKAMNPLMVLGGGMFVGLLVGGGLIFLMSTLDNKLYTPEELRQALITQDVPLLAELPFVVIPTPDQGETAILVQPNSSYLEFYERFRSSLRLLENKSLKVVLLTSTVEGEGKTVSAYNLAIAAAQAGKRTLLVEADLRSPSLAKTLKVMPDPRANIEPLRYYSAKSACIRLVPDIENLYIVPSPGPQRQAAAIIESSELKQFFEDARGRFDFVVLDTPSLSRCNDALLLQPLTDGMVVVTRPGYSKGSILAEALEQLTEDELPLLGAIINGLDKPVPPEDIEEAAVEDMGTMYEEEDILEREDLEKEDNVPTGAMRS